MTISKKNDHLDLSRVSIIFADDTNFEDYEEARARLIPVAKREWISRCIERRKMSPLRPFTPDERLFMAPVSVVCVGLEDSDKAVIHEALWSHGGITTVMPTNFTTHCVINSLKHETVQALREISATKDLKMVSKNWVFDCIRHGKLLPEGPYLLENASKNELQLPKKLALLKGKLVYLGSDLSLVSPTRAALGELIEQAGGQMTDSLEDANIYIGEYRDGPEYLLASRRKLVVATLNWLFYTIAEKCFTSPLNKLFHYPYVRNGLPEMHDFIISITNYTGDARKYLQALIERLGARFTLQLRDDNTHLITARALGAKYLAAKSWNVNTINHLWLEETYAAWEVKSIAESSYIQAGKKKNLTPVIGGTKLNKEVLSLFYEEEEEDLMSTETNNAQEEEQDSQEEEQDRQEEGQEELEQEQEEQGEQDKQDEDMASEHMEDAQSPAIEQEHNLPNEDLPSAPEMTLPSSPVELVHADNETVNQPATSSPAPLSSPTKPDPRTPLSRLAADTSLLTFNTVGRSGRAAKDKAAAKLHQDMTDLNEFQKRRRSKKIPFLPDEVRHTEAERAKLKSSPAPSSHGHGPSSSAPNASETETPTQGARKKRAAKGRPEDQQAELTPTAKKHKRGLGLSPAPDDVSSSSQAAPQHDTINLLMTGLEEPSTASKRVLAKLGVKLVSDARKATHVIAPRVCKTQNFLVSLANGPVLLDRSYIEACLEVGASGNGDPRPSVDDFLLQDPASEHETLHCTIDEMLARARSLKREGGLLKGYRFNIAPNIRGKFDVIDQIVVAHGGYPCVPIKSAAKAQFSEPCDDGKVVLLAAPEQHSLITAFKEKFEGTEHEPYCYTAEWLLVSILRMSVTFGTEGAL